MKVKTKDIKPNPDNPRTIRESSYAQLKQSIKEFPEMLKLKPLVVDENMVVLGGNMRLKALTELGIKETEVIKASDLTEEQREEFIIKDNISFGQWDWDTLANGWESKKLNQWGLGVWEPKEVEETEYKPILFPSQSKAVVTDLDIRKAEDNIGSTFQKGTERKFIETMCPECGHEFNVEQER
tara:strand:+ start:347 stop:895 length:549 start_codon:yes stop_codon:yes gene_type:complete